MKSFIRWLFNCQYKIDDKFSILESFYQGSLLLDYFACLSCSFCFFASLTSFFFYSSSASASVSCCIKASVPQSKPNALVGMHLDFFIIFSPLSYHFNCSFSTVVHSRGTNTCVRPAPLSLLPRLKVCVDHSNYHDIFYQCLIFLCLLFSLSTPVEQHFSPMYQ